ncbi:hypothetical protein WQ53_06310 [Pseudoxanthomonas suwonensis]|uniref:Trimeric autotransporter adhesin YadA-like C-terminal membrane anchor domain-containing protein n=1 Tax=Pseudoxanthomonas suwonensis TaxID=314722 RepID=A0A0E3Z0Y8_9GAMM|nr:hypothetical protein WQ53_06310 [Pseudoxanthomonas suwonensis]
MLEGGFASIGIGHQVVAGIAGAIAVGAQARANAGSSVALGAGSVADEAATVAVGQRRIVGIADATATSDAINYRQLALAVQGASAELPYLAADGLGDGSDNARVSGTGSVALGANSVADRDQVVSVGAAGMARQVAHVRAGVEDTDAINLGQALFVGAVGASWLGGGAVYQTVPPVAPQYRIAGNTYSTVGGALAAVDNAMRGIAISEQDVRTLAAEGDAQALAAARAQADGRDAQTLQAAGAAADAGDAQALQAARDHADAGDAQVRQAAAGHADAGDAQALQDANAHADAGDARILQEARDYTDARVATLDIRDEVGEVSGDYTDAREAQVRADMADADAQTLAAANGYTGQREAQVRADMDAGDAATLASAHTYADTREAAVRTAMDAGDAKALADARTHADAGDAATLASANGYARDAIETLTGIDVDAFNTRLGALEFGMDALDERMQYQDRRIARMGAMNSAMIGMASGAAAVKGHYRTRIALGTGFAGGERAIAVGVQMFFGRRWVVTYGGSWSGTEESISLAISTGF